MTQATPNQGTRVGEYDIHIRGKGRQFRSDALERFSHCHGLVPLFLYSPIAVFCLIAGANRAGQSMTGLCAWAGLGLFLWTFFEYWMHREVFHWKRVPKLHFFLHGIHHVYPNDEGRQVMPPGASLVVAIPMWFLMQALVGTASALPLFAGFIAGYVWYDTTHFWTHVGRARSRYGKYLKRHHMLHHFRSHERAFGVSTPLWDWVFGTLPDRNRSPEQGRSIDGE